MHCAPSRREKRGVVGAIKKYGKEAFDFAVIDIAESEDQLNHKERFWISRLGAVAPNGFNIEAGGNENKKVSAATREAQRKARAAWLSSGADTKVLGNGARGRKRRPEEIAAIVRGLIGRTVSTETKERIAAKQRGVKKPEDQVLRMARDRMKGFVLVREDGVVFRSYMEAERVIGIHRSAIHAAANGKTKTCGGFAWQLERQK